MQSSCCCTYGQDDDFLLLFIILVQLYKRKFVNSIYIIARNDLARYQFFKNELCIVTVCFSGCTSALLLLFRNCYLCSGPSSEWIVVVQNKTKGEQGLTRQEKSGKNKRKTKFFPDDTFSPDVWLTWESSSYMRFDEYHQKEKGVNRTGRKRCVPG